MSGMFTGCIDCGSNCYGRISYFDSVGPLCGRCGSKRELDPVETTRSLRVRIAELESALEAPATFRPITPETEIAVPCVMMYWDYDCPMAAIFVDPEYVTALRPDFTHWLPIQWPEVG